jgi:hypothetical protein
VRQLPRLVSESQLCYFPLISWKMLVAQLAAASTTFGQVKPQVGGVLPHAVADSRMSAPIEASSGHSNGSTVYIKPQPPATIPQSTTTGFGQDSQPALPPQHPVLQPLPKVSFDLFNSL